MAETDHHRDLMLELIETLKLHFSPREDVYVSGNLLWFYRQGDRRRHVSPDVLVRFGSPPGQRLNFLQWLEGGPPQVVFELTSKSTRREDLVTKMELYRQLGVAEYYLFDPYGDYLSPRLRGYHLHANEYVRVLGETLWSPRLQLELNPCGDRLRLREPNQGPWILTPTESALRQAEQERERAEQERLRAEQERQRADAAEARALQAEQRVHSLEREVREQLALITARLHALEGSAQEDL